MFKLNRGANKLFTAEFHLPPPPFSNQQLLIFQYLQQFVLLNPFELFVIILGTVLLIPLNSVEPHLAFTLFFFSSVPQLSLQFCIPSLGNL